MRSGAKSLASALELILLGLAALVGLGLIAMLLGAAISLIQPSYWDQLMEAGLTVGGLGRNDMIVGLGFGSALMVAILLLTLRLRKVLRTVALGTPFHPDNPRNLRIVAGLLAAVTAISMAAELAVQSGPGDRVDFDLTSWLAVLIVLVLAEVFREGARLKADAELTV